MLAIILKALSTGEAPLDLRRMHRIIVAADFAGELAELSAATKSGRPIAHTNEEYAVAVAKVLLLPKGEEIEILPVFNANLLIPLTEDIVSEAGRHILHVVHHELCHVHDDNKKLDAMPQVWLRHHYLGKDMFSGPLAECCWAEYAANRLSSSSSTPDSVTAMTDSLQSAIRRTKMEIDTKILEYRYHGDLDLLLGIFKRHGEFLAIAAAYVLGYIDGLQKTLEELSPNAAQELANSYFETTWNSMQTALREMWETYPEGWHDISTYTRLAVVLEQYYSSMGLALSTMENGHAYVDIPFRPETTPGVRF